MAERLHRIVQCPVQKGQLSGEIMDTMAETKYVAEEWKAIYNNERPHGSLNGMTPKRY
jgi:putative transposase